MGSISKGLRPFSTTKNFTIFHSFTPVVVVDPNVVSNTFHPLNRRVLERIRAVKSNDPRLIITTLATKKNVSKNSVVRNKAVRRVREAVYEILRVKGYGRDGVLLKSFEKHEGNGRQRLVGTLSFSVTMDSVITPWDDLKGDVETVIDKFIAISQEVKGTQAKNTSRSRSGLERGFTTGRRRFESSAGEAWTSPSYGRSLARDKSEKRTIVEGRYPPGRYATTIAIGQALQQKMCSRAGGAWGRSGDQRHERPQKCPPAGISNSKWGVEGGGRPALDVRSQRSKQTPLNGSQGRDGKGTIEGDVPRRAPRG